MKFAEEHLILKQTVRKRMEADDIKEMIRKYERHNAPFAWEFVHEMAELGLCGINIPAEYGGAGMDNLSGVIAMAEMSRIWPGGALILAVGNSLVSYPIVRFGTKAHKEKWLPDLATGKILGCFGLTESGVGSDAAHLSMRGERTAGGPDDTVGAGWLLSGEKHFITNAPVAEFVVIFARTSKAFKDHRGVTAFLTPLSQDKDSLTISKPLAKLGLHAAPMSIISMNDYFVADDCLIGEEKGGFKVAMETLNHGRNWIAAQCVGMLERIFELAAKYAKTRIAFGAPIFDRSDISDPICDMAVSLDISRLLLYYSAYLEDQGKEFWPYASLAKLFSSEELMKLKGKAKYVHGGMGFLTEPGVPAEISRILADGEAPHIYEGASSIQCANIVKAWLSGKLPLSSPLSYYAPTYEMLHELKDELKKILGIEDPIRLKNQRLPFDIANVFPLVAAWDILDAFKNKWPADFMFFKKPDLLRENLLERMRREWPTKDRRKTDWVLDKTAKYISAALT